MIETLTKESKPSSKLLWFDRIGTTYNKKIRAGLLKKKNYSDKSVALVENSVLF